ncbi:hypothetical protein [Desulfoluna spongiiphila]|uniref:hypothetical protein n=1 Tax=Desulfoluna spongiiphila TaxID=419481 RepID=UPI001257BFE7|nr:hypothetical protein [Desulfoluna spongiiphila]VVS93892.1 hypothetical protein DBB_34640 [Desulfoluna spongiiphila]
MAKKKKTDALAELVKKAPVKVLREMILSLAEPGSDFYRAAMHYLTEKIAVAEALEKDESGEVILALWEALLPDLTELNEYGGGDYDLEDAVAGLLVKIDEQLSIGNTGYPQRRELLDNVLGFIQSGNSGMEDPLYDVAYACCYDETDLRWFAKKLEGLGSDWEVRNARNIYRKIGDRDKYLELRLAHLTTGMDYYDLVTFYWEEGEKAKALEMAQRGLKEGQGRMDELREFVAERAAQTGDRSTFLTLQFEQATDRITLESYLKFQDLCTEAEWKNYESKLLARLKKDTGSAALKIRMHRKEYDEALDLLTRYRYPRDAWVDAYIIETAKELETRFPEEILVYYLSGLGNMKSSATRDEYARQAKIIAKVRRVLVQIIGAKERWTAFATKTKADNRKRPAFQEEFERVVPGWKKLGQRA